MDKSGVWGGSPRATPDGTRGFLTLSVLAIAAVTLKPMPIDEYATRAFCLLCPWNTDDVLANILLFAPLGMAVPLRGVGGGRGLMLSTRLSLTVKVVQLWIPGRDSAFTDVTSDTLGAAVGIAAAHSRLGDVLSIVLSAIARVLTQPELDSPPYLRLACQWWQALCLASPVSCLGHRSREERCISWEYIPLRT